MYYYQDNIILKLKCNSKHILYIKQFIFRKLNNCLTEFIFIHKIQLQKQPQKHILLNNISYYSNKIHQHMRYMMKKPHYNQYNFLFFSFQNNLRIWKVQHQVQSKVISKFHHKFHYGIYQEVNLRRISQQHQSITNLIHINYKLIQMMTKDNLDRINT